MQQDGLDGLVQRISARLSRRTGLGLLAGASIPFLGVAAAADAKKRKEKKLTLCVNGQTVKKPKNKAKKLQKKGATKGACDPTLCGNGGPCAVFVTSSAFTGSEIGGLAGGDAKCAAIASGAGLPGTFKAWLSAGAETPGTRFDNVNRAGPYRLVANNDDGGNPPPVVTTDFADLISCGATCLQNAIDRDQAGTVQVVDKTVWTGTLANGSASADTCSAWTSDSLGAFGQSGFSSDNTDLWTEEFSRSCSNAFKLYCFQQAV